MSATHNYPLREYIAFTYCPVSNEYTYISTYPELEFAFQLLDHHPHKWLVVYKKTDTYGRYQFLQKSKGISAIPYVNCQPMNYVSLLTSNIQEQWFFHST
jgi:hypothetical protein